MQDICFRRKNASAEFDSQTNLFPARNLRIYLCIQI